LKKISQENLEMTYKEVRQITYKKLLF